MALRHSSGTRRNTESVEKPRSSRIALRARDIPRTVARTWAELSRNSFADNAVLGRRVFDWADFHIRQYDKSDFGNACLALVDNRNTESEPVRNYGRLFSVIVHYSSTVYIFQKLHRKSCKTANKAVGKGARPVVENPMRGARNIFHIHDIQTIRNFVKFLLNA